MFRWIKRGFRNLREGYQAAEEHTEIFKRLYDKGVRDFAFDTDSEERRRVNELNMTDRAHESGLYCIGALVRDALHPIETYRHMQRAETVLEG